MKTIKFLPKNLENECVLNEGRTRTFEPNSHIEKYENATILPSTGFDGFLGGVILESGECAPYSAWMQGCEGSYEYQESNMDFCDEEVLYLGTLNNGWGHAITDNFRHAWIWHHEKGKALLSQNLKMVYVTVDNTDLKPYVRELYLLAGCDVSHAIRIQRVTRFKAVYVPSDCLINVEYGFLWSDSYKLLIDTVKQNVLQKTSKEWPSKIYFTRSLLPQSTRDIGEPSVERVFRKLGYTIIAPEKHTVVEQIQMMLSCKSIAATEGSVAHTAVFCNEGSEIICLLKTPSFNQYQFMINDMNNLAVTYVDIQNSFRLGKRDMWFAGPFYLLKTKELANFAKDRGVCVFRSIKYFSIYYWMYKFPILAKIGHKIRVILSKIYTYIQ